MQRFNSSQGQVGGNVRECIVRIKRHVSLLIFQTPSRDVLFKRCLLSFDSQSDDLIFKFKSNAP